MTVPPKDLTETPVPFAADVDALSGVLRAVRLWGGVFLDAEFSAPWCVLSQVTPDDCGPAVPRPERIIAFHYIVAGRLLIQAGAEPPAEVRGGHMVMLPRNEEHLLASGPGLTPIPSHDLAMETGNGGFVRLRYGAGGEKSHMVCGFVGTDARSHPLLDALPSILVLDLNGDSACEWISSSFRYAAGEHAALRAGSAVVLAKLSELLFVEAVRRYIEKLPPERGGWLAGLRDPVVGRALALLHSQIARPWTADELAREVCLSRSAFAERFTRFVGMPPMKYLAAWRMQLAAQRLRDGHRYVTQVAAEVGYDSEAAFTRAFKRKFSLSPARWRKDAAQQ
ncbi:MAG TPA: AraC family transcriptional regulator [Burkholderiales bacterium]|nr:AraC family transcriptional regulator [Burkholderiales bacterium]